jgi:hypothetical protein
MFDSMLIINHGFNGEDKTRKCFELNFINSCESKVLNVKF